MPRVRQTERVTVVESTGPIVPSTDEPLDVPEAAPKWYREGPGFFGNLKVSRVAGAIYGVVALAPLGAWALGFEGVSKLQPQHALIWAVFVAMGWPVWAWLETMSFERWVRSRPTAERPIERSYFKQMNDCAKSFWAAVVFVYAVAAYLGFKPSFADGPGKEQPNQHKQPSAVSSVPPAK